MDIHELRQFESVYKPSKEVAFCWLRKQYVQLSTEENHTEIVDHANDSLRIWKAAKAKSVPEVINVGNELQSWVAVWSFKARHDREDYIVVDANLLAEKIENLTGANA